MARIRTIKPEFFKHEALFDLEKELGLPIRLAFEGLWIVSDRAGRFKWRPRSLKLDILPYDDVDFSRVLDALWTRGYLVKYTCGDEDYGWIPTFLDHQVINNRERDSDLPEPTDENVIICPTHAPHVAHTCPTPLVRAQGEGKGKEGKGKEGKGKKRREYPARFEQLWKIHPKGGKDAAYRAMKNIGPDEAELDLWVKILEASKVTDQWKRGVSPNLSTWINQGYFDGEIPKSAETSEDHDEQKHQERIDQETLERRATSREWEDESVPMPEEIRRTIKGVGKKLSAKEKDKEKEGENHEQC